MFKIDGTSPIYFIQEIEGERYELLFGDGVFGEKLQEPNYVTATYITCSNIPANGVSQFKFAGFSARQ